MEQSQQRAARLVGFLYLFTNLTAIFAFVVRGRVIATGDAAQTASNIIASDRLFRAGIVAELITISGVIMLIVALYVILRPVDRPMALLATLWRMVENIVLAVVTLAEFATLTFLEPARFLGAIGVSEKQSLAYAALRIYGAGFNIGFFFLGLGSALFSYLWLKSGFVPRVIAIWGIFASSLMAVCMVVVMIFPALAGTLSIFYLAPMGIYEIGFGLWLLIRGIHLPAMA